MSKVYFEREALESYFEIRLASRPDLFGWFCARLAEAPVADVVEVVHGKWIWKDGKCFCSACHEQGESKYTYQDGTVEEYDYCPNCGAKMDLEE